MIALDTNVLVRILVNDDLAQVKKARALVKRLDVSQDTAYISNVVLCELVWVLRGSYNFSRMQISNALKKIITARQLTFQAHDQVIRAIGAYEIGQGDFADYLIRESAQQAGCEAVATFDRKLHKESMFSAL